MSRFTVRLRTDFWTLGTALRLGVLLLVTGLLVAPPLCAQSTQTPSTLQASDLLRIRELSDVTISPSGRSVAYTVRRAVPDSFGGPSSPRYHSQIRVISASGREGSHVLTRPDDDASQPAWHPDGNWLAFVRPVDGTPQIFVLALTGGEPYQLTDHPYGATDPTWSPSGDRLLFSSRLPVWAVQPDGESPPRTDRPGRGPGDLRREARRDTLLVFRDAGTLTPLDTLAFSGGVPQRLPGDTARTLQLPARPSADPTDRSLPIDSLGILPEDSLDTILGSWSVRPDTVTVKVPPDTAASPDGELIQVRRWIRNGERRGRAHVQFRSTGALNDEAPFAPTYQHYFVVDVPGNMMTGDPSRPPAKPVTKGYRSFHNATWLPGGTQLLVSAPPVGGSIETGARNLYVVDLAPYRLQRLLSIDGYRLTDPKPTSDGTTIAFRLRELSSHYDVADIGLFELDGRSAPRVITQDLKRDVTSFRWSPDGWYIYATTLAPRGQPLYRLAPFERTDTSAMAPETSLADAYDTSRDTFSLDSTMVRSASQQRMIDQNESVLSFDVTDSRAVYVASTPANPSELYTNTVSFQRERRLTAHNVQWLDQRRISTSSPLAVRNETLSIEGRVTKPTGSPAGAPLPVVFVPRGSPLPFHRADAIGSWFQRQYLAAQGFASVEVWPRGAFAYGDRMRWMSFQNWGPGPASDVHTVADTVGTRAWVDDELQFIAGRSYGAYLTAWLLGRTTRFRAGVAQSGVYDLSAFLGEGRGWTALPEQFGGYPWKPAPPPPDPLPLRPAGQSLLSAGLIPPTDSVRRPARALRANSPLRFAPDLASPLLLLHGAADRSIPPTQSERLFNRLRVLERPAEYVRYPGVRHDFSVSATPTQRVDRLIRLYEFISRFATPSAKAPQQAQLQR